MPFGMYWVGTCDRYTDGCGWGHAIDGAYGEIRSPPYRQRAYGEMRSPPVPRWNVLGNAIAMHDGWNARSRVMQTGMGDRPNRMDVNARSPCNAGGDGRSS
ncbi:MAG: hypothetical protein ACFBSF_03740 [Leptolyngbyaceae cyanobacterium]